MQRITASVGRGGRNYRSDVKIVQQLLNKFKLANPHIPLVVDGIVGPKTIGRIEAFQRQVVKLRHIDGRVDPNGRTIKALNQSAGTSATASGTTTLAPKLPANQVKVTYSSRLPADQRVVSSYALEVIKMALQAAGMRQAVITSTIRTPEKQAAIMYWNASKNLTKQYQLYGKTGDLVLDVYKANAKRPKHEVIKLMVDKINQLKKQGRRVSRHLATLAEYKQRNVFDIGVNSSRAVAGSTFSIPRFTKALRDLQAQGYIATMIDETNKSNTCWHIEIIPNAKPLPKKSKDS